MIAIWIVHLAFLRIFSTSPVSKTNPKPRKDVKEIDLGSYKGEDYISRLNYFKYDDLKDDEEYIQKMKEAGVEYLSKFTKFSRKKSERFFDLSGLHFFIYYSQKLQSREKFDLMKLQMLLVTIVYILDDSKIDKPEGVVQLPDLNESLREIYKILKEEHSEEEFQNPEERALAEFVRKIRINFGERDVEHLLESITMAINTMNIQLKYKNEKKVMSEALYLLLRDYTGCVEPFFEIAILTNDIHLSEEERRHPLFKSMINLGNRIICHHNDIYSLVSEMEEGINFNLVLIRASEKKISMLESLQEITDFANSEFDALLEIEREINEDEEFVGMDTTNLKQVLDIIYSYIYGNLVFGSLSKRYIRFDDVQIDVS